MATSQTLPGGGPSKITKVPVRMVKPILKKFSHTRKTSLDLDHGWEDQRSHGWPSIYESGSASRSAKDVGFVFGNGEGVDSAPWVPRKFQHTRSPSGTSHVSVATNASSNRVGHFVHPFQQTPRGSTPPLSYANSLASFDNQRDYSPAITEGDDDVDPLSHALHLHHQPHPSVTLPQPTLRRPSFASQRTSSFSEVTSSAPPVRLSNGRSTPVTSRLGTSRLNTSQSDLHQYLAESPADSYSGNNSSNPTLPQSLTSLASAGPASTVATMSPLRTSLEVAGGFPRLRSRSEVDAGARAEHIREARRKFEAREKLKEEKYDREQVRKRERRDTKEASRIEREGAALRKGSFSNAGIGASLRKGSSAGGGDGVDAVAAAGARRPSSSRKNTSTPPVKPGSVTGGSVLGKSFTGGGGGTAASSRLDVSLGAATPNTGGSAGASRKNSGLSWRDRASGANDEKQVDFMSSNYESVPRHAPPQFGTSVDDVRFNQTPRRPSTKRKTQGYWHGFILWVRTKLLRLGGK